MQESKNTSAKPFRKVGLKQVAVMLCVYLAGFKAITAANGSVILYVVGIILILLSSVIAISVLTHVFREQMYHRNLRKKI